MSSKTSVNQFQEDIIRFSNALIHRLEGILASSDMYNTTDPNKVGGIIDGKKVNIEWKSDSFTINDIGARGMFAASVDGHSAGTLNCTHISDDDLKTITKLWREIKSATALNDQEMRREAYLWFWANV